VFVSTVKFPVAESVVNAPDPAVEAPMLVPSIAPPPMSTEFEINDVIVTAPVLFAIEPAAVPSLALMFVISRFVALTPSSLSKTLSIVTPLPAVVSLTVLVVIA